MLHNRISVPLARPLSKRLLLTARQVLSRPGASSTYLPGSTQLVQTVKCSVSRARLVCWRRPVSWLLRVVFCLGLPARQYERRAYALRIGSPTAGVPVPPKSMQRFLTFVRRSSAMAHPGSRTVDATEPVYQRLGFIRESDGDTEYLIQRESWKSLMAGRDARRTARELAARGILKRELGRAAGSPRAAARSQEKPACLCRAPFRIVRRWGRGCLI